MRVWLRDLGLEHCPPFFRDRQFIAALAAGMLFWIALRILLPGGTSDATALGAMLSLCVIQPILEELIFRGAVQGELLRYAWGSLRRFGFSAANIVTSLIFTALHFLAHPPLWAIGVLVPSLLFGHFRERHNSLYPPLALHIYYNTGYFLTTGFLK
jgi:uncharacterized protein